MTTMRLDTAMIYVKDLDGMAAFYGQILGLRLIEESRTDTWVEFDAGGAKLALHAIPPHIAVEIEISSPPVAREETPMKLVFTVDDISRLKATGVTLVQRPWGTWDGIDPEGNLFAIIDGRKSATLPSD